MTPTRSMYAFRLALFIFSFLIFRVDAQISRLEAGDEVTTLKKVFRYIRTIGDHPSILVVYDKQSNDAQTILEALRNEQYFVATSHSNDLQSVVSNFDVIYVMPGTDILPYRETLFQSKVLVVSGDPTHVANGLAAIAVAEEKNHPVIYLNLRFLSQCGHEVSAELINLSKVYK